MLEDDDEDFLANDPRAGNVEAEPLPFESVPVIAKRAIGIHDPKTGEYIPASDKSDRNIHKLRELLTAAVKGKLITPQQIVDELGPKALDVLKGRTAAPHIHRALILRLAELNP